MDINQRTRERGQHGMAKDVENAKWILTDQQRGCKQSSVTQSSILFSDVKKSYD